MADNLTLGLIQIPSNDLSSVNDALRQICDNIDKIYGLRGAATIYDTATVSTPVTGTDAATKDSVHDEISGFTYSGWGYDATTFRITLELKHDGTKAGFIGAAPVVAQTVGAVTNNVTAGGVDGTIANITDLLVYANDAAAIRNDIYQLARSVKQLSDALRIFGLGV